MKAKTKAEIDVDVRGRKFISSVKPRRRVAVNQDNTTALAPNVRSMLANEILPMKLPGRMSFREYFRRNKTLYFMLIPGLLNLLLFKYLPMWGIVIGFENYYPFKGVFGSKWVGFTHFVDFFADPYFFRLIRNTFLLGAYSLIFSFPAPIILALLLSEMRSQGFKKVSQTISYMPYFFSTVIVIGLLRDIFGSGTDGVINSIIVSHGGQAIPFFARPEWFRFLYISSGIWQGIGFGSIIYLAAIAGVNPELYESAVIDGCGRFSQVIHITLPTILPTVMILFILSVGGILGSDFQKIILMYGPATWETSDVISTYVYRVGIEGASSTAGGGTNFSYATAVGLFTAGISLVFVVVANRISKSLSEYSLW